MARHSATTGFAQKEFEYVTSNVFATYTTAWHDPESYALVESLLDHNPGAKVFVFASPDSIVQHPKASVVEIAAFQQQRPSAYPTVYSPNELALALVPDMVLQLLEHHDHVTWIDPGCIVVGPLDDYSEAEVGVAAVVSVPPPSSDVDSVRGVLGANAPMRADVIGYTQSATPFLENWSSAVGSLFSDTDQRFPSQIASAKTELLMATSEVHVVRGSIAEWSIFSNLEQTARDAVSVVAAAELFRIGRETAMGRYQNEEVAWSLVFARIHDVRSIEPLMEYVHNALERTGVVNGLVTPYDDLVSQSRRASDPFGVRWPLSESDEFADWLYETTRDGVTRIAHIYWHQLLRDVVPNPIVKPKPLIKWCKENSRELLGFDLLSKSFEPRFPEHVADADATGDRWSLLNAVRWRWNVGKQLVPWQSTFSQGGRSYRSIKEPKRIDVPIHARFPSTDTRLTLFGGLRSESGLGQASRATFAALESLDRQFSIVDLSDNYPSRSMMDPGIGRHPVGAFGDINLIHSNAEELIFWSNTAYRHRLGGRYNVGFWFWETANLPERMQPSLDAVDELWVATEYLADVFGQYAKVPVHVVGLAADLPDRPVVDRRRYGVGEDEFVFLFVYDAFSSHGRKNPEKVLRAFIKAFGPRFEGVRLILKASNINKFPKSEAIIHGLADDIEAISVIERYLDRSEVLELMAVADVYVSLHASEGYGLTLLEAMALGTPCIATGYSGNMDFTDARNSWLVDYKLVRTREETGPYPKGSVWAEPSIDMAAEAMKEAEFDRSMTKLKAELAMRSAKEAASLDAYASRIDAQLRRIGV